MSVAPHDYRVDLDIYNGPLDLLLYLIRRDEIEIYDIPIAHITQQFIDYLEVLRAMDLNKVGDFLVMAATLMEVKSKMLLPPAEDEEGDEEEEDPRLELVRQLLEYKRFKDAAMTLSAWGAIQDRRLPRPGELDRFSTDSDTEDDPASYVDGVELWHLVEAFATIVRQTGLGMEGTVVYDDTPIEEHMRRILDLLEERTVVAFSELFEGMRNRGVMLGCFLAILELAKQDLVRFDQARDFSEIILTVRRPDAWSRRDPPKRTFASPCLMAKRVRPLPGDPRVGPAMQLPSQMRTMREMAASPARRRAYDACFFDLPVSPAIRPVFYEPLAPTGPPKPWHALVAEPKRPSFLPPEEVEVDAADVEEIDVQDVAIEAPEGWVPPPPPKLPELAFRRRVAAGAGRRLFAPSRPGVYVASRPLKLFPLPRPSEELLDAARRPPAPEQKEASPAAEVAAEGQELPARTASLLHKPAAGKGRKLFVAQYPLPRSSFRVPAEAEAQTMPEPPAPEPVAPPETPLPVETARAASPISPEWGGAPPQPSAPEPPQAPAPDVPAPVPTPVAPSMPLRRVQAAGKGRKLFTPAYPLPQAPLALPSAQAAAESAPRAKPAEPALAQEHDAGKLLAWLRRVWAWLCRGASACWAWVRERVRG